MAQLISIHEKHQRNLYLSGVFFPGILSMDTTAVINTDGKWPSRATAFNWLHSVASSYFDFIKEVPSQFSLSSRRTIAFRFHRRFHEVAPWTVVIFHWKHASSRFFFVPLLMVLILDLQLKSPLLGRLRLPRFGGFLSGRFIKWRSSTTRWIAASRPIYSKKQKWI